MSEKNPCLECKLKNEDGELLLHADKNHPECKDCSKRVDYVKSLGGMAEGVPDNFNMDGDAGKSLEERISELDVLAGKRFQKTIGKDVDMSREQEIEIVIKDICEDCFTDVSRVRAGGRTPEDSKARRLIVERLVSDGFKVPQAKIAELVGVTYPAVNLIVKKLREGGEKPPARLVFKVDFTDHRDLYDYLIGESAYRFRTPEDQVLYMLRKERDVRTKKGASK